MDIHIKVHQFKELLAGFRYSATYVDNAFRTVSTFVTFCTNENLAITNKSLIRYYIEKYNKDISDFEVGLTSHERQVFRFLKMFLDYCYNNSYKLRYYRAKDSLLTSEYSIIVSNFQKWIQDHDYSTKTSIIYARHIKAILCDRIKNGNLDIATFNEAEVLNFIKKSKTYCERTRNSVVSASKKFIAFLRELSFPVPEPYLLNNFYAKPRYVIPPRWTKEEFDGLIKAIDKNSPKGKRDYAMLLLARTYGLRAVDIRNLRFEDIDWKRKTITVNQSKTNRNIYLPLLKTEGWAIIDYITNGRPNTDAREIFIRHNPPYVQLSAGGMWALICHYIDIAGLKIKHKHGFHSLRATLASELIDNNVALEVTSQVLGHKDLNSTKLYIQTSFERLRACCLDIEETFYKD